MATHGTIATREDPGCIPVVNGGISFHPPQKKSCSKDMKRSQQCQGNRRFEGGFLFIGFLFPEWYNWTVVCVCVCVCVCQISHMKYFYFFVSLFLLFSCFYLITCTNKKIDHSFLRTSFLQVSRLDASRQGRTRWQLSGWCSTSFNNLVVNKWRQGNLGVAWVNNSDRGGIDGDRETVGVLS